MKFQVLSVFVITVCCVSGYPYLNDHQKCKRGERFGGFIVGGETAEKGEWRWVVAFKHASLGIFFCGGSVISNRHVLSGNEIKYFLVTLEATDDFLAATVKCRKMRSFNASFLLTALFFDEGSKASK